MKSVALQWSLILALAPAVASGGVVVNITQVSSPPGNVVESDQVPSGQPTQTIAAPLRIGSLRFTHWELRIDGSGELFGGCASFRCPDATGQSLNPVQFTPIEDITATAFYIDESVNDDGDALPDHFELRYVGDLTTLTDLTNLDSDDLTSEFPEFLLGTHPNLFDSFDAGGVSLVDSDTAPLVINPDFYLFKERSTPAGLIDRTQVLEVGTSTSTLLAPDIVGTVFFAHWTVNSVVAMDPLSGALNPAPVTMLAQENLAEALFLSGDDDTDMDGVADWFELRYFGDLMADATTDDEGGAGDGLELPDELQLGFVPNLVDTFQQGGVSLVDSDVAQVNIIPLVDYLVTSSPVGTLPIVPVAFGEVGDPITVGPVASIRSGLRFGYWETQVGAASAVIHRDTLGIPLNVVTLSLTDSTVFTGYYFLADLDSDDDGLPDWFELGYFGDEMSLPTDNPDGDSLNLGQEVPLGFAPTVADTFVAGGVSLVDSDTVPVDLRKFPKVREILIDGAPRFLFSSDPTAMPDGEFDAGALPVPALLDFDGDNDRDLLVAVGGGLLVGYENLGSPVIANLIDRSADFSTLTTAVSGFSAPRLGSGDFNNDGQDEVAVGGDSGTVTVYDSDGTPGGFSAVQTISTGASATVPGFAEMTGDSLLDLVVVLPDGSLRVYPNTGSPTTPFDEGSAVDNALPAVVPGAIQFSTGDVDEDGLIDIAISDASGNIWEFHRQPDDSYQLVSRIFAGTSSGFATNLAAHLTDLDGDGDQDVIAGYEQGGMIYLRNQGKKLLVGPPTQTIVSGDGIQFDVINPESAINWFLVENNSGGSIDGSGNYTSGPVAGTVDVIEARDANQTLGRAYANVIDASFTTQAGKAIIVGAGTSTTDSIWPATNFLSRKAYLALRLRGFSKENITFLSLAPNQDMDGNGLMDDIDGLSNFDNLQAAFADVVGTTDKLFVYLVDHGSNTGDDKGEFRLDGSTRVSADQIKQWIDTVQLANGGGVTEVIAVLDFCYAGSFLDEVTRDSGITADRMVLSATDTDELTYFISRGQVSYSDSFFNGVLQGFDLETIHGLGATSMAAYQSPILDDNDSGTFQPGVDGSVAATKTVGASFVVGQDVPILEVAGTEPSGTLVDTTEALIFVDGISSVYPIDRVWCAIAPPGFTPNLVTGEPVIDVPEVDLEFNSVTQRYEADFDGFTAQGIHKLNCFAEDFWDSVSFPKQTQVTQAGVVDKLLVVLGGNPASPRRTSALAVSNAVYASAIIRGYDDSTIHLLTSEPSQDADGDMDDDKDGDPTLSMLAMALDPIAGFASDADRLSVVLISPSNQNRFQIDGIDTIDATGSSDMGIPGLDSLLDTLQATNGTVVHLYMEFPGSGALIPNLVAPDPQDERLIVASSGADSCNALDNNGLTSFTNLLMDQFQQGATIGQGVKRAGTALRILTSENQGEELDSQASVLDEVGFGDPNNFDDQVFANARYFGGTFVTGEDRPSIGSAFEERVSTQFEQPVVFVEGVLAGNEATMIDRVFAVVSPPGEECDGVQQILELDFNNGRWEAPFTGFGDFGRYGFTFYAIDDANKRSTAVQSAIELVDDLVFEDRFEGN